MRIIKGRKIVAPTPLENIYYADDSSRVEIVININNPFFVEKIKVVSGFDSADEVIGTLLHIENNLEVYGRHREYIIILKTGRIIYLSDDEVIDNGFLALVDQPELGKLAENTQYLKALIEFFSVPT